MSEERRRSAKYDGQVHHERSEKGTPASRRNTAIPEEIYYENTYKLEPDKPFNQRLVKEIMIEVLESNLKDEKYNQAKCRSYCKSISQTICERVKLLGFLRHKIICVVNIGEKKGQGVRIGSRCFWNQDHDKWVEAVYESHNIFAVAVTYGVYKE